MSSLIVEICKIEKVEAHPNADKLDICIIKGWQCVVPKGRYKDGDLITYVPIDGLMPVELSDRLGMTQYLGKNGRVKCARLRGQPSFGVIFDNEKNLPEGSDVAIEYGIEKYMPPVRVGSGDSASDNPLFPRYTNIENFRNFPNIFQPGDEIVVTEKIHGRNCRIGMVESVLMAGSHKVIRKRPENDDYSQSMYWYPASLIGVVSMIETLSQHGKSIVVYGEIYGPLAQNYDYGVPPGEMGFSVFDILVDGNYLDHDVVAAVCVAHAVKMVPEIYRGPYQDIEQIKTMASGNPTYGGTHCREGIVVKSTIEKHSEKIGRHILKYISDEYLFGTATDNEDA